MKNFAWILMVMQLLLGVAAAKKQTSFTKVCFISPRTGQLVCVVK